MLSICKQERLTVIQTATAPFCAPQTCRSSQASNDHSSEEDAMTVQHLRQIESIPPLPLIAWRKRRSRSPVRASLPAPDRTN